MQSGSRRFSADRLRLLVFDLDGTLIDSRQDLCNSVNATLRRFGRPELPDVQIAGYIGDGAAMLIRRALGHPEPEPGAASKSPSSAGSPAEAEIAGALDYFLGYYREHKLDCTLPYPGVMESLATLHALGQAEGRKMAVLTNKPVGPARAICEALGMGTYFFRIYGGDSFPVKKPDPLGLNTLMREAEAAPEQTLMVGDSDVDIRTARNAGAWSLGCTFGLSTEKMLAARPDLLADRAADWTLALIPAEIG